MAQADAHFDAGEALLEQGDLAGARQAFDRAVLVYLKAPGGAYAHDGTAEAYRRMVEAILARERAASATDDGQAPYPGTSFDLTALRIAAHPLEPARRAASEQQETRAGEFPVVLNDAVLSCIDLYQGRLRDWFSAALARGGRYLPLIRRVFATEGIPEDLAYVALVESAFRVQAVSPARATGVWQFMSATARRFGLRQDPWVDERHDPEKSTRAAARYLKELHGRFGDWDLALAGYNAGERRVERAVARHRTGDFWKLRGTGSLRRETSNYVPLVHAAIAVARSPGDYGFEVLPEPARAAETVRAAGGLDLRAASDCAGTTLAEIRLLNPELRRNLTPPGRAFSLRVPPGTGPAFEGCLKAAPAGAAGPDPAGHESGLP